MSSYLCFGTGIISLWVTAVPPVLWDLAADGVTWFTGREEKKARPSY